MSVYAGLLQIATLKLSRLILEAYLQSEANILRIISLATDVAKSLSVAYISIGSAEHHSVEGINELNLKRQITKN